MRFDTLFSMATAIIHTGQEFETWYMRLLKKAEREICISTFRFENPMNKKCKVLDRLFFNLAEARKRKVTVKVLLNLYDEKIRAGQINKKTARELQRFGCLVKRPQGNAVNHAKLLIVDGQEFICGSHNLTRHSFGSNFEISLYYSGDKIIEEMRNIYNTAFKSYISI